MKKWKPIKGFDGLYEVGECGSIKSLNYNHTKKPKILKGGLDKDGYRIYSLMSNNIKKTVKGHRVVALHFIDNPENKPQVNHINGIKDDNRAVNLSWVTNSENQIHAFSIGLQKPKKGKKNGMYGRKGKLNPFYGKTHTDETKNKIRQSLKISRGVEKFKKLSK